MRLILPFRDRSPSVRTANPRSQRVFVWGVVVGIVFAVIALPILEPGVLAARNYGKIFGYGDFQVAALSPDSEKTVIPETTPSTIRKREIVKKGSNLMETLLRAGASRPDAYQAIVALEEVFDPRMLRAEQAVDIVLDTKTDNKLVSVVIPLTVERAVAAQRDAEDAFVSHEIETPLTTEVVGAAGVIEDSLFQAMSGAGLPDRVTMELIRIYGWDVDFQRDIQRRDQFSIMYETLVDPEGNVARIGNVLMASLNLSGTELRLYRHELADGSIDYFNEKGESVRKSLLRTPVDGARLSSRYGSRRHPILGYTRMHRGVDFAAPKGTPIMAAGDGVIEFAGTNGTYGRYIRIRHNSSFKTAYAHLNGFRKGIRVGARVQQGQTIGYIGTTGRSTGPHLHYEVLRGGAQVNPLSLKLPTGQTLTGKDLDLFQAARSRLEEKFAALVTPVEVPPTQTAAAQD
jgi:murein DD-endopeptidase MepM/ murein hydrolase activator NlpD